MKYYCSCTSAQNRSELALADSLGRVHGHLGDLSTDSTSCKSSLSTTHTQKRVRHTFLKIHQSSPKFNTIIPNTRVRIINGTGVIENRSLWSFLELIKKTVKFMSIVLFLMKICHGQHVTDLLKILRNSELIWLSNGLFLYQL